MKILLTEKTRQEKIIEKRNLFGLGLTSLIAACGGAENAAENEVVGIGKRPTENLGAVKLDEEAESGSLYKVSVASNSEGGLTDRNNPDTDDIQITVSPAQRGLSESDSKGYLIFRIASGDHSVNTHVTSINKFGGDEYNLILTSDQFGDATANGGDLTGAVYIFWDIKDKMNTDLGDADKTLAQKHLRVAGVTGDTISNTTPTFYQDLGGEADQADMLLQSSKNFNIIWDVTKYATTDTVGETELTLGTSPGILQIQGTEGLFYDVRFIKVNNNDNYDMTMTASTNSYIIWDITNYHDADATDATSVVELATAANATHGLLKVTNGSFFFIDPGDLTDIDGGGVNDLIFLDSDRNTCILFGEKIANTKDGKVISYSVDWDKVAAGDFYDKAGDKVTVAVTPATEIAGFFHYDLDGDDATADVKNVGYRFSGSSEITLGNPTQIKDAYEVANSISPAEGGELSEEAYWDIA